MQVIKSLNYILESIFYKNLYLNFYYNHCTFRLLLKIRLFLLSSYYLNVYFQVVFK